MVKSQQDFIRHCQLVLHYYNNYHNFLTLVNHVQKKKKTIFSTFQCIIHFICIFTFLNNFRVLRSQNSIYLT